AADGKDDGCPVGVRLGREDVHRQGRAELAAVDHILLAVKSRLVVGASGARVHPEARGDHEKKETELSTHGLDSGKTRQANERQRPRCFLEEAPTMTPQSYEGNIPVRSQLNRRAALRSTLIAAGAAAVTTSGASAAAPDQPAAGTADARRASPKTY